MLSTILFAILFTRYVLQFYCNPVNVVQFYLSSHSRFTVLSATRYYAEPMGLFI